MKLKKPRELVENKIKEQIKKGTESFLTYNNNFDKSIIYGILPALKEKYGNWEKYNRQLIKTYFSDNEILEEYINESEAEFCISEQYEKDKIYITENIYFDVGEEEVEVSSKQQNEVGLDIAFCDAQNIKNRVQLKIQKLHGLITLLDLSDGENNMDTLDVISNNKVFIVHGHDESAKDKAELTLKNLGLTPIILHQQANEGKTIIEKFEKHSDVGFAVILLTPDDVGGKDEDSLQPRARQNVIAELGYFVAKLGRERVFPLKKAEVEIPSDFAGVLYTEMDNTGKWQFDLVRELKAVGFAVDANKLI
jgi:predicted nucleotide-binding protein